MKGLTVSLSSIWAELRAEPCTMWFQGAFGVDWSMSCWAHDKSWMICTLRAKLESDLDLFMDLWAIASIAGRWWQRVILKVNAVAMGIAVATVGWLIWIRKYIKCRIDGEINLD
jgi:hypothetical protein